jgi:SAM-dependent methyltransferase
MAVVHGNRQKHQNANPLQQFLIWRFHRRIADLVRQTDVNCLLDAGCGEGFTADYLLRESQLPLNIIGSDISLAALQWARANQPAALKTAVADIHHLPYADNSFPLVICLEVLEHIPDSAVGLRELARVSSRYLLVSVPHEPFFRGANFLRGKHLSRWGNDPEHLHTYSGRAFRCLIESVADIAWQGFVFPWQIILAKVQ